MKNIFLLVLICSTLSVHCLAQSNEVVRVKSGGQVPTSDKYLYPQFSQGMVYLRNGQKPAVKLNYQLMLREIQFLAPAGDTLTLAQLHNVSRVTLNGDVFVFDQNNIALKLLGEYGTVALGVNQSLQIANVDKEGAYGQSSGLSSINSYSSYPTGAGPIANLEMKGDVVYSQRRIYFFINQNSLALPATRKNVLKMFPRQKSAINEYLQQQPVQFNNPDELKRLLEFCSGRG